MSRRQNGSGILGQEDNTHDLAEERTFDGRSR